jgi:hypothetical protein
MKPVQMHMVRKTAIQPLLERAAALVVLNTVGKVPE